MNAVCCMLTSQLFTLLESQRDQILIAGVVVYADLDSKLQEHNSFFKSCFEKPMTEMLKEIVLSYRS